MLIDFKGLRSMEFWKQYKCIPWCSCVYLKISLKVCESLKFLIPFFPTQDSQNISTNSCLKIMSLEEL